MYFSMSGTKVFVARLASDTREKDLERFFKGYGQLRDVVLKNGYGFVVSLRNRKTCLKDIRIVTLHVGGY